MNPDNPTFRTPEEESRAEEYAKLKAEVDHLNRQLADAMSGCCDCPMFKAQGKTVAELKAENDILKSKASQFESTLKETMRVRDAEIKRLKRYTQHRIDCIRRVGVFEYSNDCDCGLEAIGKGEK